MPRFSLWKIFFLTWWNFFTLGFSKLAISWFDEMLFGWTITPSINSWPLIKLKFWAFFRTIFFSELEIVDWFGQIIYNKLFENWLNLSCHSCIFRSFPFIRYQLNQSKNNGQIEITNWYPIFTSFQSQTFIHISLKKRRVFVLHFYGSYSF